MQRKPLLIVVVGVVVLICGVMVAAAQGPRPLHVAADAGTGFTYQGQLKSGGAPVNAGCNFVFRLYDDATAGNQVGSNLTATVTITNGLFTKVLDFGSGAITGNARWLDMQVQCPPAGSFTPLTPRQALTAAPLALALPGLWTQQNGISPNLIGGFSGNVISPGVVGATIGGGGRNGFINRITFQSDLATIGGGSSNTASGASATVGGGYGNIANLGSTTVGGGFFNTADGVAATVSGGSYNTARGNDVTVSGGYSNTASQDYATVGGGSVNNAAGQFAAIGGGNFNGALGQWSTVSGGYANGANTDYATVGGGQNNVATGQWSTVSGGYGNGANADDATVAGGQHNVATGINSTIVGGDNNIASMPNTLAAGHRAKATDQGAFVWADSVNANFASTGPNQFLIRAGGGVGILDSGTSLNPGGAQLMVASGGGFANPQLFITQTAASDYARLRLGQSGSGIPWDIAAGGASDVLNFYHNGDRVTIGPGGILTATGGFSGQCLQGSNFNTTADKFCNMDVAEAFATTDRTEPGDVVALVTQAAGASSPSAGPTVHKAGRADGALIVGVVSSNPGLVFDNGQTHLAGNNSQLITADRTVVALIGRVPVKLSLENGPIAVGDPLTAGSTAGAAMKATQAGQIIGYALQSSDEQNAGKLLVWLQPGLYVPPAQLARLNAGATEPERAALVADSASSTLAAQVAQLQARNVEVEARMAAIEQARATDNSNSIPWLLFAGMSVLAGIFWRKRS